MPVFGALVPSRVVKTQGEGQALAEEYYKKDHEKKWEKLKNQPDEWKKVIGKPSSENRSFRKFELKYTMQ